MSHPVHHQDSSATTRRCVVLWLGANSPLLAAAWSRTDLLHVQSVNTLLVALQNQPTPCVVVDVATIDHPLPDLLRDIRRHSANSGVLALVDTLADEPVSADMCATADLCLSRYVDADALLDALDQLTVMMTQHAAASATQPGSPAASNSTDQTLKDQLRHLQGLIQATFTISRMRDEGDILGDLRRAAQFAVSADDMAVLLTDDEFTDLSDPLRMGVPGTYLETCRGHLRSLPQNQRPAYIGDEVLVRAPRTDDADLPNQHEAAAASAQSYLRVPLTLENKLIGFVGLFCARPHQFHGAHLELARMFAAQVANTVRNMRLYLRLNRAEQQQQAVSRVASLIADDLELDLVLMRIAEEAVKLVRGLNGVVLLRENEQQLRVRAAYGHTQDVLGEVIQSGEGQTGQVLLTGQPSIITNYTTWEHANPRLRDLVTPDMVLYAVPLRYHNEVLGVLQVIGEHTLQAEIDDVLNTLLMLAPQAAIAIAKAQLHATVEQDRRQLRAILDHTNAAVAVCDEDGTIRLINPAARRILAQINFSHADLIGQRVPELLAEWHPDHALDLDNLGPVIEVSLGRAGEYVVHIAPIANAEGHVERYVGVAQDVTELRRVDRMKSDMVGILTHDLGNLLMLARNPIEMLDEPDLLPEQRDQLKGMLVNSLIRMEELVNDVVDLDKAEELGQETIVAYRVENLIQRVLHRNRPALDTRNLHVEYTEVALPPEKLQGHAMLIGQAIDNLVTNAIKYTPDGGRVDIRVNVAGEYVTVQVQDTGFGIADDKLPFIFDPFFRVKDRRTIHIPGTGLGLSLVRTIAEGHGGHVTVESEPDVGSTFTLYLPLGEQRPNPPTTPPVSRLDLSHLGRTRPAAEQG